MHRHVLQELWEVIPQAPNYMVSNYGEVINRFTDTGMSAYPDKKTQRLVVALVDVNGRKHKFYVHRLVAAAYLVSYDPRRTVWHKSGDFTDNSIRNLKQKSREDTDAVPKAPLQLQEA